MAELVINFLRGTDEFLTCAEAMGTGRPPTGSSGTDCLQEIMPAHFSSNKVQFFLYFSGALSPMEILNAIFVSDSYIKLFSLALCIIQCLSTFQLKILSKILFIQFWGCFNFYAVSNMIFKTVQKLLTNFFKTFCYLEDSSFSFADVLGKP